jgi:hypothetical protein
MSLNTEISRGRRKEKGKGKEKASLRLQVVVFCSGQLPGVSVTLFTALP